MDRIRESVKQLPTYLGVLNRSENELALDFFRDQERGYRYVRDWLRKEPERHDEYIRNINLAVSYIHQGMLHGWYEDEPDFSYPIVLQVLRPFGRFASKWCFLHFDL